MEAKKMSRGMEWIIGSILALIIAIVGFHYTKKPTAIIAPVLGIVKNLTGFSYFSCVFR